MKQYCQVGDIVLAVDHNHLYEAKILRVDFAGSWKYFIHYQNWQRKFDCWVDEQEIAKRDDKAKQEKIVQGAVEDALVKKASKKTKKAEIKVEEGEAPAEIKQDEAPISTRSGKAITVKEEEEVEEEDDNKFAGKRKIVESVEQENLRKYRKKLFSMDMVDEDDEGFVAKLPIPFPLRKHLIEEHALLTTAEEPARVLELPKPKKETAESIIKEFLDHKKKAETNKVELKAYQALLDGLLMTFDTALPSILLYRQERAQYDALCEEHPDVAPSQLYGAEHLLRFFVRLPSLLGNVCLPPAEVSQILAKLTEVIKYLNKTSEQYLDTSKYVLVKEEAVVVASEEEPLSF